MPKPLPPKGANVCLGDLSLEEAQEVADRINAAGNGKAIAVKMDVTKREGQRRRRCRHG